VLPFCRPGPPKALARHGVVLEFGVALSFGGAGILVGLREWVAQDPQMPATADLNRGQLGRSIRDRLLDPRPGRFSNRVRESQQVVMRRWGRYEVGRKPNNLPATRGGQPLSMDSAEVVTMRLGVRGQRPKYRRGIRVDVR
jgi:hypothetical protein